jgi:hypothetical protein
MKYLILLIALLTAAPAHAIGIERGLPRETILERLVDAEKTLASWNIAGCKARLEKLNETLATEVDPFKQAVKRKSREIIEHLAASRLRDAEDTLQKLVIAVRDGVMQREEDSAL